MVVVGAFPIPCRFVGAISQTACPKAFLFVLGFGVAWYVGILSSVLGAPRTSFWTMHWWLVKGGSDESDVGMLVPEDVEVARDFALFRVVSFSAPVAVLGA